MSHHIPHPPLPVVCALILIGGIAATGGAFAADEPPTITVPDDPFEEPAPATTCVSQGVVAGRGPHAEGNLTGDWEHDIEFDCDGQTLRITIDDSTLRLLVAAAGTP